MDDGIGRTGYRLLALMWTALGFLGATALWLGFATGIQSVLWGGFGMLAVSLAVLFSFTIVTPNEPRPAKVPKAAKRRPTRNRTETPPAPNPEAPAQATGGMDFEFDDAVPAADAAPEDLVMPDAFHKPERPTPGAPGPQAVTTAPQAHGAQTSQFKQHDPAAWPGQRDRNGQSTWTTERKALDEARKRAEAKPKHKDLQSKYTRNAPVVRDILSGNDARPTPPPGGKTRGKCGDCGTVILAPPERPIKLRCPKCSKVTLLKA